MRLFLLVALTLLLGGLYLYLDGILEMRWWVETRPEQTQLQWQGWEAALHAWPLVLVGVLVGGGMVWALFGWAYGHAEEYDHAKEIEQVQQIAASTQRFGFTNPVLVSGEGRSSPAMAAWRCGALSAFS